MTIKIFPNHIRNVDGSALVEDQCYFNKNNTFDSSIEIPHFINVGNTNEMSAILLRGTMLNIGDEIKTEYGWKAIVKEIKERRPARGDWSLNSFDKKPDFILFSIE